MKKQDEESTKKDSDVLFFLTAMTVTIFLLAMSFIMIYGIPRTWYPSYEDDVSAMEIINEVNKYKE